MQYHKQQQSINRIQNTTLTTATTTATTTTTSSSLFKRT